MKSSGGTSRSRPFLSCNCASARPSDRATGPRDCRAAELGPGVAGDKSGSLSTHSMCHSESRRHATRFGNSLAGRGRPSRNSSSSPVSKNVPYASAKTPRDVTHASFIDRVVPSVSREPSKPGRSPRIAPPPTTGHARRACILPSTVHAALTKPPNASDRITSPRSDARSLEDAATTNSETVRRPISEARAGSSGSPVEPRAGPAATAEPKAGAVAAVEPKAGTPPELPKAGAG
mmetsp:Transcript_13012/g.56597  ORF Transcript_13012/g.56597 Transcript_13012/m.56597 type:complete len:234 (+) Transcript_13012:1477-2178(+)